MKIIDEKGKLFGLINIIDLAVILVLAVLLVGGASRLKDNPTVITEEVGARIVYEVADVRMATVNNIKVGEELYHYDKGVYIGEIENVEYKPHMEPVEGDGEWILAEVPEKFDVHITVAATVNNNPDVIVAGGEQTRIGGQYRMKNKRVAFFGTVLDMELED